MKRSEAERRQDILNDVETAVRGSNEAMARLRRVEPALWPTLQDELVYFLVDGDFHTLAQVRRMGRVMGMSMDYGGRETLARCLDASSSWTTRLHAAEVIGSLGPKAQWAEAALETIAADEAQPLRFRNAAARAAASVAGRPAPPPILPPPLPRSPDALDAALAELDWDLRDAVVACANDLGETAEPVLARHLARWRDAGVSPSRIGSLMAVCAPLEAAFFDVLDPEAVDLAKLCEIAAAGLRFRPELEPRFERLLAEAPTDEGRRAASGALARVTGEYVVEWLTRKDDEVRRVSRESLARVAPEHLARQGGALFAGVETELAVWGWETTDPIVAALGRASEDALVEHVAAHLLRQSLDDPYWRPEPRGPGPDALHVLTSLAERHRWARRVQERLGGEAGGRS